MDVDISSNRVDVIRPPLTVLTAYRTVPQIRMYRTVPQIRMYRTVPQIRMYRPYHATLRSGPRGRRE
eukprot:366012-Chlamydomonas_euryale.AAC.5